MDILLIIKTPPPITGVTLTNLQVKNCLSKHSQFSLRTIKISYKKQLYNNNIFYSLTIFIKKFIILVYNLLKKRPSVIYFQISLFGFSFFRDFIFITIIKIFRIPLIFHIHGKGIKNIYKNSNIYRYLYRFAFSNEYIITLSSKLLYDINIFNAKKTFVINNGIKDYSLNYTNLKNENFIILYLSHLQISKGIKDYVFSISCLIKNCKLNNQKIKGYIIGDEIDITKKYLNEFIKSNKIEHFITYLGPKYNQEKNEYLKKASVLVYPTLNDAFPLVLIEAMQFGIPVIATREGAIPEIVDDGVTGFLVDKHSPDQIAEKLKILLDDDVLRNNMGKSARKKYLEKYTIEVFEKNLIDVFQKISLELK